MSDRDLRCWGRQSLSIQGPWYQVSAGQAHFCAIHDTTRELSCWGENNHGQTDVPTDLGRLRQVSAGGFFTCTLDEAGFVTCFGDCDHNQCNVPENLAPFTSVSAGQYHACALRQLNGRAVCWGHNDDGQTNMPGQISGNSIEELASGYAHTCGRLTTGNVHCRGSNANGETTVPARVVNWGAWQVVSPNEYTCALTYHPTNPVSCWGRDWCGETQVPYGLYSDWVGVIALATGTYSCHTCAWTQTGELRCWGDFPAIPNDLGFVHDAVVSDSLTCVIHGPRDTTTLASIATTSAAALSATAGTFDIQVEGALALVLGLGTLGMFVGFTICCICLIRCYVCGIPCCGCGPKKAPVPMGAPPMAPLPVAGGVVVVSPPVSTMPPRKVQVDEENPDMGMSPMKLSLITDGALLSSLQTMFTPPPETKKTLGFGRDYVTPHKKKNLVVKAAWKILGDSREDRYIAKLREVQEQLDDVRERAPGVSIAALPSLTDGTGEALGLDGRGNAKMLLHGTQVKHVANILECGLDESYTSAQATFGRGVYLAEDPAKADQYTDPHKPEDTDETAIQLSSLLYEAARPHPGEVFYAFVCQAVLGCPVYTKGPPEKPVSIQGRTASCGPGEEIFADEARSELTRIPGTNTPFHCLVVEKGEDSALKRHAEFVIFDGKAVLPKYLVAYSRE